MREKTKIEIPKSYATMVSSVTVVKLEKFGDGARFFFYSFCFHFNFHSSFGCLKFFIFLFPYMNYSQLLVLFFFCAFFLGG